MSINPKRRLVERDHRVEHGVAVELGPIQHARRDRVRGAITEHIPADEWERLRRVEALEKKSVERVFRRPGKAS